MKLLIPLSENGYLPDMYGKYAPRGACIGGNPVVSFPFTIEDPPSGVKRILPLLRTHAAGQGPRIYGNAVCSRYALSRA